MGTITFPTHDRARQRRGSLPGHAGSAVRAVDRSDPRAGVCHLPPGWPREVDPPVADDWELSAVAYLLDCCPSEYRGHPVLRRHPVVLARFAAEAVEGQILANRTALSNARTSLHDLVEPQVLDGAIDMLQAEEARLVRVRRAVALVEEALRGKIFLPTL